MNSAASLFFNPRTHLRALTELVAASLERNDGRAAFMFADRRCRLAPPRALDLLARAEALRMMGDIAGAQRDLDAAIRENPTETAVNRAVLNWGASRDRLEAAERMLEAESASPRDVDLAVRTLWAGGREFVTRTRFVGPARAVGWALWRGRGELVIEIQCEGASHSASIGADPAHRFAALGSAAAFELAAAAPCEELRWIVDGRRVGRRCAFPTPPPLGRKPRPRAEPRSRPQRITIVVPVYRDPEATLQCLDTCRGQRADADVELVVVDDATPEPELRAELEARAASGQFRLLQNPRNRGFVDAVNLALEQIEGGDVLLLNSDAALPDNAVARLARAAYSRPDIGTVVPFSNHGEFTSFPVRFRENPLPSAAQAIAWDTAFATANAGRVIPIPSGTGFCLYIKRECLDAIGPLSRLYAPGYGEDSEWSQLARQNGFLNVCAADVFVPHAGGRSFRAAKRALVMRNLRIVEERFPDYEAECAAFVRADPLKTARAAAERAAPPQGPVRLIVACARDLRPAAFARAAAAGEGEVLILSPGRERHRWDLRNSGDGAPQSLQFDLSEVLGRETLEHYLDAVVVERIEILGFANLSEALAAALTRLEAPVDFVVADSWPWRPRSVAGSSDCDRSVDPSPCRDCAGRADLSGEARAEFEAAQEKLARWFGPEANIAPLDRLSQAFAGQALEPQPQTAAPSPKASTSGSRSNGPNLAIFVPQPSVEVDRLCSAISRAFVARSLPSAAIVFGAALNDLSVMATSGVFVAGPMAAQDWDAAMEGYEIGLVLSPYRSGFGWLLDRAQLRRAPRAYFDWSYGKFPRDAGDLALDPRLCDRRAAALVANWASTRLEAPGMRENRA